jgi:hypothetical protein
VVVTMAERFGEGRSEERACGGWVDLRGRRVLEPGG